MFLFISKLPLLKIRSNISPLYTSVLASTENIITCEGRTWQNTFLPESTGLLIVYSYFCMKELYGFS